MTAPLRILAIVTGEYGKRHAANLRAHRPTSWTVAEWEAPSALPLIVDDPADYVPDSLDPADLLLSVPEHRAVAELIPDVARVTGARAVIAPVDNEAWLPRGLARQLRSWLADQGVSCVTPKPLCSLTETQYATGRRVFVGYDDPLIAAFARHFGAPALLLTVDPHSRIVTAAEVQRDAVCGAARWVADRLVGTSADAAEQEAGLLHHHYPCLASMGIDTDYDDTLMHVSGNILKECVRAQVRPFVTVRYIDPSRMGPSGPIASGDAPRAEHAVTEEK